ncbi:MAG: glutamate--tRNA ligase [Proteobacteria bacterium]|nr:glutamate--tRNA ligase [Pseudomonadota bacterium]
MDQIITRFPPSPTGYLHVGGARTALFNWLYARNTGGKFILRIEDTDAVRSTQESVDAIFESLKWLEIDWDDGPYFQTKRYDLYKEYIQNLVDLGHAYYCTCTPEEIDAMREKAKAEGGKPRYDGRCRDKNLPPSDHAVVRLKAPPSGTTVIEDVVKGTIVFQNSELDDYIIQRSDGSPTYNLAVAVDDITMGVNVVLRGDDHVNNTPKQMMIYQALGIDLPVYGHLPMVLGSDKARLSKRHGAMSVSEFRDMGILPDAMLNYLVRLGWSFGDQEFFTRNELIEKFNLKNIGRSAGVFDQNKLLALNGEHIKASNPRDLIKPLRPFMNQRGYDPQDLDTLEKAIGTLLPRSKTLVEMAEGAEFYFTDIASYDEKAVQKCFQSPASDILGRLIQALEPLESFAEADLEHAFKGVMDDMGIGFGKVANPVRVALSGKNVSPGMFEMMGVLGKALALDRLKRAKAFIDAGI